MELPSGSTHLKEPVTSNTENCQNQWHWVLCTMVAKLPVNLHKKRIELCLLRGLPYTFRNGEKRAFWTCMGHGRVQAYSP